MEDWTKVNRDTEKAEKSIKRQNNRAIYKAWLDNYWALNRKAYSEAAEVKFRRLQKPEQGETAEAYNTRCQTAVERATYKSMDCGKTISDCESYRCQYTDRCDANRRKHYANYLAHKAEEAELLGGTMRLADDSDLPIPGPPPMARTRTFQDSERVTSTPTGVFPTNKFHVLTTVTPPRVEPTSKFVMETTTNIQTAEDDDW
jgi:hypothetical protein